MLYNYILFMLLLMLFMFILVIFTCNNKKQDIFIVYYAFINPINHWRDIIIGQLQDIKNSGILQDNKNCNVNLDIVLSGKFIDLVDATIMIETFFKEQSYKHYKIHTINDNLYEYPGINQLYIRSIDNPGALFLYLHSKGMAFHRNEGRIINEVKLTPNIVFPWKKIIQVFKTHKHVNKVTIASSDQGWGWYNFFWARGTYLRTCEKPIISDNRHYYESWVGFTGSNTYKDCYNIIEPHKEYYTAHEADRLLENLEVDVKV